MIRLLRSLFIGALALGASASTIPTVGVGGGANNTTCSEATTFIARTTGLDAKHVLVYNEFICALVSTGLWAKTDALWLLATQDETTAGLNLKSASFTLTPVSSPTFTTDRGYTGNLSTSYLNTSFNLSSSGTAFTQNSAFIAVWPLTNGTAVTQFDIGASNGTLTNGTTIDYLSGSTSAQAGVSAVFSDLGASSIGNAPVFLLATRTASNASAIYANGVSAGTSATASQALVSGNAYIGALNLGGSPFYFSDRQIAFAALGGGLTAAEATIYYNLVKQCLNGIGAI